ncbi:MAG: hypothetical protein Q8O92_09795 [Candidatus Latescibacter sp.]|nr:hypothetical protein [Candidatus Latescibacter sp.]
MLRFLLKSLFSYFEMAGYRKRQRVKETYKFKWKATKALADDEEFKRIEEAVKKLPKK